MIELVGRGAELVAIRRWFDSSSGPTTLVIDGPAGLGRTTAADTWFAMYETTDSIDALKAFYEDAIAKAGLQVISTTTANGGIAWAMATDASGSFGGAVSIFPTGDGKNAVQVTVGKS